MKPTFGSLFAGVGGFDMGMEQAGWDCRFQVEWDKNCQTILNKHWPTVPKWGDVSTVSGTEIPPVDCIIFGSPCQDLSVAGKRAGLEGERSGLFHQAIRIIKEMRDATNGTFPRWAIWENVAGALSSNAGRDFGTVINEMVEAGAVLVEYALLDAQYFGVPQRRRRVFVVACFDSATAERCPDPLLPVCESLRGDSPKGKSKGKAVTGTTSASVGNGGQWWDGGEIADTLTATSDAQRMPDKNRLQVVMQNKPARLLGSEIIGSLNATDFKWPQNQQLDENKFIVEPYVEHRRAQTSTDWSLLPVGVEWFSEAGVPWEEPIPSDGTRVAVRRLTPLECERLMGWPDDHTRWKADGTEQADTHRYKQCGNGVATPVARWIATHILKTHQ